jgi:hypothetical protein
MYTVAELIADLQKLPSNLPVYVGSGSVWPSDEPQIVDLAINIENDDPTRTTCCCITPLMRGGE